VKVSREGVTGKTRMGCAGTDAGEETEMEIDSLDGTREGEAMPDFPAWSCQIGDLWRRRRRVRCFTWAITVNSQRQR
jgi:hypothetical protein